MRWYTSLFVDTDRERLANMGARAFGVRYGVGP